MALYSYKRELLLQEHLKVYGYVDKHGLIKTRWIVEFNENGKNKDITIKTEIPKEIKDLLDTYWKLFLEGEEKRLKEEMRLRREREGDGSPMTAEQKLLMEKILKGEIEPEWTMKKIEEEI